MAVVTSGFCVVVSSANFFTLLKMTVPLGYASLYRCGTSQHGLPSSTMALITSDCVPVECITLEPGGVTVCNSTALIPSGSIQAGAVAAVCLRRRAHRSLAGNSESTIDSQPASLWLWFYCGSSITSRLIASSQVLVDDPQ